MVDVDFVISEAVVVEDFFNWQSTSMIRRTRKRNLSIGRQPVEKMAEKSSVNRKKKQIFLFFFEKKRKEETKRVDL